MKLHEHHSYVLKQHRKSLKLWSAIIRIITEGKSLISCFHVLHVNTATGAQLNCLPCLGMLFKIVNIKPSHERLYLDFGECCGQNIS